MVVMYRGMEQSLLKHGSFALAVTLIPLGFTSDTLAVFEGQII